MKKLFLFVSLLITSFLLVSCTLTDEVDKGIHEKYNLNNDIKIVEKITKEDFRSLLYTAWEKEQEKDYCNIILNNFINKGEVTIKYDLRGDNTSKYKVEILNPEADKHLYVKDSKVYVKENGEKRESTYEYVFGEYEKEELLYVFTFLAEGIPTVLLLESLVKTFDDDSMPVMIFNTLGIDEDDNCVIDITNEDGVTRFVFNEDGEFIYVTNKANDGEEKYCISSPGVPSFKFPSFSGYEYFEKEKDKPQYD